MEGCNIITREEISKRFDLPERKSKIETIFKMKDVKPVYCICHSADISRFMICCEKCDEWYHGDCIGMKESLSKYIKKWYCFDCVDKYQLEIVYFSKTKKSSVAKKTHKNNEQHQKRRLSYEQESSSSSENSRCGQCSNCLQNKECGNKDYTFMEKLQKHSKYGDQKVHVIKKNKSKDSHSDTINMKKVKYNHDREHNAVHELKQCVGPNCCKASRLNSKYCSDDCGLALAKLRILYILPERISKRAEIPCVADSLDKDKLNKVRAQKKLCMDTLKELGYKKRKVLDLISRSKRVPIVDNPEEVDDESKMNCFVCGWEIHCRSAVRHMGNCFKKFESLTEFVGPHKTNQGYCDIFCEYFDPTKKTYCKRLRYVCPNHFKPKKVEENEVCGCPIIKTMSSSILCGAEKFCQRGKIHCDLHYNWEALALADVDLERFREMNKYSELVEEEGIILRQLTNRTGTLGVLLHSTEPNYSYDKD